MRTIIAILGALGAGALIMYLFDPNGGNRRRALIRDKAIGLSNDVRETVGKQSRHLSNKAKGLMHEAKEMIPGTGDSQGSEQAERIA